MTRTTSVSLLIAAAGLGGFLLEGCSSATQLFYVNKNTQAIRRDTITPSGVVTTIQNPQDSVNGIVRLVPVESLNLQPVTVAVPAGAPSPFDEPRTLMVPPGFAVRVHAHSLGGPRDLVLRDDGTIFFSDTDAGEIAAVAPDGTKTVIAQGLRSPFGLELHEGALYYTDETRVFRYDFTSPNGTAGTSTMLTDKIPTGSLHYTRTIRWSPNDKRFYISVGSLNNKDVPETNEYATVFRMPVNGGRPEVAARGGLRNTMAMDIHPETGELWGIDQGTDWLSMDLAPDEVNIIKVGKHYGWPYYYSQNFRDPDHLDLDPATFPKGIEKPIAELQGHSMPSDMEFYTGTALGADWKNAMVIAYHGSWNREPPTGYKVVRVRMNPDGSNARQADFVSGFLMPDGKIWGSPAGVTIAKDGTTFYISDDKSGAIYKVYRQ